LSTHRSLDSPCRSKIAARSSLKQASEILFQAFQVLRFTRSVLTPLPCLYLISFNQPNLAKARCQVLKQGHINGFLLLFAVFQVLQFTFKVKPPFLLEVFLILASLIQPT
jgi:hypothetical protein